MADCGLNVMSCTGLHAHTLGPKLVLLSWTTVKSFRRWSLIRGIPLA
ncbi:rCG29925 [Rattus norvegicus]|uniref:RCG29925 n=1 Tax=Rattus norvegicus TaxID=10116 RepID=A6IMG7_RAT|nr:rCG29925 [Rattus norvegicus]